MSRPQISQRFGRARFVAGVVCLTGVSVLGFLTLWATVIPLTQQWSPVAVISGSMAPAIQEGDIVLTQTPDLDKLRKKPDRSLELASLGIVLVPDVLERTPPYVDYVEPGSPAAAAGIRPDDLVLLLGVRLIQSCKALRAELEYIDYEDAVRLTVLRDQELREILLQATPESGDEQP